MNEVICGSILETKLEEVVDRFLRSLGAIRKTHRLLKVGNKERSCVSDF
jgi:hypothetical protein